jgi:hypothetical protein
MFVNPAASIYTTSADVRGMPRVLLDPGGLRLGERPRTTIGWHSPHRLVIRGGATLCLTRDDLQRDLGPCQEMIGPPAAVNQL